MLGIVLCSAFAYEMSMVIIFKLSFLVSCIKSY
uniref:Uncharacterized protein n=1 Tax=Arundo donax TaxID=35708 RepID=A0A0A8ZCD8_ARUDO